MNQELKRLTAAGYKIPGIIVCVVYLAFVATILLMATRVIR